MKLVIVFIFLFGVVAAQKKKDFCVDPTCKKDHIGCVNKANKFDTQCGSGASKIVFTPADIEMILDMHNKYRNKLAGGEISDFKPALRMGTMRWEKDFATIAEFSAKRCKWVIDKCRKWTWFLNAGESIGIQSYRLKADGKPVIGPVSYKTVIKQRIDSWWAENINATMDQMTKYPEEPPETQFLDFAHMVFDNSDKVGCAMVKYTLMEKKSKWQHFELVCVYASTALPGFPVYLQGPTASKCYQKNRKYGNLCSINQPYGHEAGKRDITP